MNTVVVIIYPYKFTDFVYNKLEIAYYKKYCEVIILDISAISSPNFANAISVPTSYQKEVVKIKDSRQLKRELHKIGRMAENKNVLLINELYSNSFREYYCNLLISSILKKRNIKVLEYYNAGVPTVYPSEKQAEPGFHSFQVLVKLTRLIRNFSTFSHAFKTLSGVFYQRLGNFTANITTHRLIAGKDYDSIAKESFRAGKSIELVYGHSEDYSTYLLEKSKTNTFEAPYERICTYIDGPGPMFTGDVAYYGRKVYFTSEVWYPALSGFFDMIEAETGVKVVISGHYKSRHPDVAPCFGNRYVYYGKTKEMVERSEFVITRASTAISYAVIFRKPVIFIYSNQLLNDNNSMYDIKGMAASLGNLPVNIDCPDPCVKQILKINEEYYSSYKNACLTSALSDKPNFRIILEEVMQMQFQEYLEN